MTEIIAFFLLVYLLSVIKDFIENIIKKNRERNNSHKNFKNNSIELSIENTVLKQNIENLKSQKEKLSSSIPLIEKENLLKEKEKFLDIQLNKARQQIKQNNYLFQKNKEEIELIINEKSQTYPWLADLYAEYLYTYDEAVVAYLKSKKRPAEKAADNISRISKEKRELTKQLKLLEHQLCVYENLFPWLTDFKEISVDEAAKYAHITTGDDNEYSILKNWLSPEEYNNLPNEDKYQLALDRYNSKPKTNWQIGIEYERYIGYMCEQNGYHVKYNGALSGLEDMGRDLILKKGKEIIIIQCKYWSKEKTIHEKHIFQLYGSVILEEIENPKHSVKGVFVTSTTLSNTAQLCADKLGIIIISNYPLKSYPQIKCNISKNKEKIYHLPFDQQYDRTIINSSDGDFYAQTVKEAENNGFRRAWRWNGNN